MKRDMYVYSRVVNEEVLESALLCNDWLYVMHGQSCSVSKGTFDLTVTRWMLLFKSANIIILCLTKASMW